MTPNFNIVNFDELKATTKTFIVMTNIKFNLNSLFTALPITTYEVDLKKRGKKRIRNSEDLNNGIENGSIITLKFENKIRGIDMKQKLNNTKKKSKWFRNSFTVVMIINNKQVNFKICKNGILQFTGCKYDNYVDECLKSLWKNLKNKENSDLFSFTRGNFLECLIIPAMRNIDFNVGFNIDREKLSMYISKNTNFYSLLETSFGYTGVNIKIPITKDLTQLEIMNEQLIEALNERERLVKKIIYD